MRMNDKPNVKQVVPFFGIESMEKSLAFYVDGLGFKMTNSWTPRGTIEWCWLELGGTAIMLQEYRKDENHSWRPEGKLGTGMSTVFICGDAIALYKEFEAKGLKPSRPFVGNRMWVTTLHDPDGYVLHFESNTDAEEESVWKDG
jgi:lactoylglutathione lyase